MASGQFEENEFLVSSFQFQRKQTAVGHNSRNKYPVTSTKLKPFGGKGAPGLLTTDHWPLFSIYTG